MKSFISLTCIIGTSNVLEEFHEHTIFTRNIGDKLLGANPIVNSICSFLKLNQNLIITGFLIKSVSPTFSPSTSNVFTTLYLGVWRSLRGGAQAAKETKVARITYFMTDSCVLNWSVDFASSYGKFLSLKLPNIVCLQAMLQNHKKIEQRFDNCTDLPYCYLTEIE